MKSYVVSQAMTPKVVLKAFWDSIIVIEEDAAILTPLLIEASV